MTPRAVVLLLITAALWGASYLFMKVALEDDVSESVIICMRTALGACVLVPLAARAGALRPLLERKRWVVGLALAQVIVPFGLIVFGENWIASGLTGILISTAPIFLALMAPWLDPEEGSSGIALVGIVVGMTGVVLLLVADLGGAGGKPVLGGVLVLIAAAIYGLAPLIVKRRFSGIAPVGAAAGIMVVSAIVYLPPALLTLPEHGFKTTTWASLVILGAGGTGISFYGFYELIADIGPARASVVAYVAPMFSVIYGVFLLNERLTMWTVAGMVLILGGSWLAARRAEPAEPA